MPDVGVLQLRISADASNAARSLKTLQTRLSEINQIAQTFNLSNVATQIGDIVKQVSSDKATSTAVKNLGSLLNAISAFSKVTKLGLNKSQIEQISALQSAVSGFNLGQSGTQLNKLREALGGEWNTEQASKVRDALVTMSGGAKTLTDSGTANTIKETAKAVEQMSSGTANEIKTASAEMENFGQTTGNTANILDRLGSLQSSIFGRIPSHYMSMQGSVLNETSGFAESESQIKEVSVVAKDATADMQDLKSASEETASSIGNIDISRMVQGVEQAATYMALADKDVASGIDEANSRLEEQIRLRREALEAENQARLENNYQNYRELFLSKEGEWEQQVPEMYGFTPKALEEGETYADAMKITMQEVNEYVDQFIDKMNTPSGPLLRDSIDDMLGIGRAAKSAEESAKALQHAPEIKEATQEVQTAVAGMANSMTKSQTATKVLGDNLKELDVELKEKKSDIKDVTNETKSMTARFSELMVGSDGLGGSFKRMFPAISGLLGRFKQLVKYRMLRAIIRQIAKAFKEGTENYYHYSQAIGGTFAPAMDNATSTLLQMKNSIGAAAAPVIQALIPYLQMAVNWFITAINYANQFFALLGGQTSWSRAVPQTAKAFDNVKKSAGGASAAMKDLLADWDELNIIQSESGGGGGGGGAAAMEDYLNMFEESSIFDEKIKNLVEFVKDNFDDILDVAKAIGVAILGWKVSNAFGGLLGKLGSLVGTIASIYLGVKLTDMFGKEYIKTGEPGWLVADALSGALGAYLAGKFAKKLAGSAFGYEVAGITLIIEGAVNIKNALSAMAQQRDAEAWALDALGSIEIGIGAGLAAFGIGAGGPVSLAIGAAVTVGTFLLTIPLMLKAKRDAEYKQMAIDAFSETNEDGISTEEYIKALQARADELTKGRQIVIDVSMQLGEHKDNFFKNLLTLKSMNALISSVDTLSEEDATKFKEAWHIVVEELKEIEQINFETIYKGLDDVIANGSEKIKKEATALRKEAIELARIMGGARGALQEEMSQLTNDIISGTLTGDEYDEAIARYEELYKIIAESEDSGMADLQKRIKEGASFDFSTGENPVDEAVNFIKTLSEQEINPVLEATKEAYDAELNAIEDTYKELEMLRKAGKLSDEEYNQSKAALDRIKKLYDDAYKDRVEQITALTKDAYETVMNQALAGLSNIDMEDSEAAKAYVDNVLSPIYAALEDAGYEIPKNVKVLMGLLTDGIYQFDPASVAGADRQSIYEAYKQFADLNGEMDIEYPVRLAIAYEIDKNKGQPVDFESEAASDIINSLIRTFDYQMEDAFELMSTNFGWSFADIFSKINLKDLNVEQLEYLADTLAYLKEVSQENLNPSSGDYNSEYTGIEDEYNAIIEQLQQAIKEHTELPEMDLTQPVTLDVETENVNSDINEKLNEKLNEELQGASGGGGAPSNYANIGASVMQGINATFANMKNILPWMSGSSDVTVKETRDSGEEIGNTAEGTRQGTSEIVTGQNTMNGYMQQVALSTAGMVDSQGTANSYMAQMVSLLRTIASQGGGAAPAAQSVMGGMVAGALAAFEAVRG